MALVFLDVSPKLYTVVHRNSMNLGISIILLHVTLTVNNSQNRLPRTEKIHSPKAIFINNEMVEKT